MSYKLKQDSIGGFSEKVASTLCNGFYAGKKRADGAALMKFTDSKQVNSFLVKNLFEKWQSETTSLQSPYFDFEHKVVKEALKEFMNKLSEYISVAQQDLEPLVAEAVADTVLVTFDPVAYVNKIITGSGSLSLKYIKARKASFKKLKSLSAVSATDFDEKPPESPEDFVNAFGMDVSDLFEEESLSFFDRQDDEDEDLVIKAEEVVTPEVPVAPEPVAEPDPEPEYKPEPMSASEPEPEAPQAKEDTTEGETAVESSEQSNGTSETLNDRFNKPAKVETLADKLHKSKKKSLEDSLNLNEKFMFINSLFEGDKGSMSDALSDLDQATDHDEAKMKAYKYSENWDMESEEVEAFFDLIERRFA